MAYDASIDYQAKKNELKKLMDAETDPKKKASLQTEYDAADQARLEKMASNLSKYGKYASDAELDKSAGIAAETQIGTAFDSQVKSTNSYYDQAKQNANNSALSRGMARSSYVQDREASLDSDRAAALTQLDADRAASIQNAKQTILENYSANQANALADEKKEFANTIGAYYNDYQAEINNVQNNNDSTDDWKIPYLQAARNEKIQAQQAAAAKAYSGGSDSGGTPATPVPQDTDWSAVEEYVAKGGDPDTYFKLYHDALGFENESQAKAAYEMYNVEKNATPEITPLGDAQYTSMKSQIATLIKTGNRAKVNELIAKYADKLTDAQYSEIERLIGG